MTFFAILADGGTRYAKRVRVSRGIQETLTTEFVRQANEFVRFSHRSEDVGAGQVGEESQRISYFPVYQLTDRSQIFEEPEFELEQFIIDAAKNPDSAGPLELNDDIVLKVKAFCAARSTQRTLEVYFQAFDRRRSLTQSSLTFLQGENAFQRLKQTGFTLANEIHAIYKNGTLLFRSYHTASRFLELAVMFDEASSEKVEEVLSHDLLYVEDMQSAVDRASSIIRRQLAAVSELGVLDRIEPKSIKKLANEFEFDVDLRTVDGKKKLVFPESTKLQRQFLHLLTDGYYRGPASGEKMQSNSHRPLKKVIKKAAKKNAAKKSTAKKKKKKK